MERPFHIVGKLPPNVPRSRYNLSLDSPQGSVNNVLGQHGLDNVKETLQAYQRDKRLIVPLQARVR